MKIFIFFTQKKMLTLLSSLLLISVLLCGCGNVTPIDCPFTDLGWETSEEELLVAKGNSLSTYASTYGGTTYTYEGFYMEQPGTLKYMYDGNGILMNVAWAYSTDDEQLLLELYNKIHADLEAAHGKSGYNTSNETNYGDVWELKEGNIILTVMITASNKALQLAYENPLSE